MNLFDGRLQNSKVVVLDREFTEEDLPAIEESIYHSLNQLISTNRIITDENYLIPGIFRIKVTYTPD